MGSITFTALMISEDDDLEETDGLERELLDFR